MQKLDGTGAAVMSVDYDPFGNIVDGTLVGEYGFSTKPLVDDLDWYYYGFRYYDPVTGRWPSRDPIAEDGGLNLYSFVGNDGANNWDYLGEQRGRRGNRGNRTRGTNFNLPAFSFNVSTGYAAQMCFPIGGAVGIVVSANVTLSSGTCCDDDGITNYTTVDATFSVSLYSGVCTPSMGPVGDVSLGLSDSCPDPKAGTWSGSVLFTANASIWTVSCSAGFSGSWSCSSSTDFSRATSVMVTVGGSFTYTAVEFSN